MRRRRWEESIPAEEAAHAKRTHGGGGPMWSETRQAKGVGVAGPQGS